MRSTLESTLPWWIAGPVLGLVIVSLLGLANKRFGVLGGVTDLVQGSTEGRVLAVAVTAGVLAGVALQPRLAASGARWRTARGAHEPQLPVMQGADVL